MITYTANGNIKKESTLSHKSNQIIESMTNTELEMGGNLYVTGTLKATKFMTADGKEISMDDTYQKLNETDKKITEQGESVEKKLDQLKKELVESDKSLASKVDLENLKKIMQESDKTLVKLDDFKLLEKGLDDLKKSNVSNKEIEDLRKQLNNLKTSNIGPNQIVGTGNEQLVLGKMHHNGWSGLGNAKINQGKNAGQNYALIQNAKGHTLINSAKNQTINFRINNQDKMVLNQSGNLTVNNRLNVKGTDLFLNNSARRAGRGRGFRRALVHNGADALEMNYGGDYTGGVKINGQIETAGHIKTNNGKFRITNKNVPETNKTTDIGRLQFTTHYTETGHRKKRPTSSEIKCRNYKPNYDDNASLVFSTGGGANDAKDQMVVRESGRVGINTMNPSTKLHVNGGITINGENVNWKGHGNKKQYINFANTASTDHARLYAEGSSNNGKLVLGLQDDTNGSEAFIIRGESHKGVNKNKELLEVKSNGDTYVHGKLFFKSNGYKMKYYTSNRYGIKGSFIKEEEIVGKPINYWWSSRNVGSSGRRDNVFIEFSGPITSPITGRVTFYIDSDDGSKFYLYDKNNKQIAIANRWRLTGMSWRASENTSVNLIKGESYRFKLNFYEHGGAAGVRLYWKYGNMRKPSFVPTSAFVGWNQLK